MIMSMMKRSVIMEKNIKILSKDSVSSRLERFIYSVHSIAYISADTCKSSPKEILSNYRIMIVAEGETEIAIGNAKYNVKAGDCVIFSPGSLYSLEMLADKKCGIISFTFSLETPIQESEFTTMLGLKDIVVYNDIIPQTTLAWAYEAYKNASSERRDCYFPISILVQRIVGLVAYHKDITPVTARRVNGKTSSDERLVMKSHNYIINHVNRNVSVEELCKEFSVSQSYIYKCFRNVLGVSTKEFITTQKIHMTEIALLHTDKSITEIALENGYANSYQFSNIFKKVRGISPSAYRKINRD